MIQNVHPILLEHIQPIKPMPKPLLPFCKRPGMYLCLGVCTVAIRMDQDMGRICSKLPQKWLNARHAWAFTLFGISVAAGTVHLWNSLFVLFLFLIGSGVWMADSKPPRKTDLSRPSGPAPDAPPTRRKRRETLF